MCALNIENSDLKALSEVLRELNESYLDFASSMAGTVREMKNTKKLWHNGQKPWLIKLGLGPNSFSRASYKRHPRQPPNSHWNRPGRLTPPSPPPGRRTENVQKRFEGDSSGAGKHAPFWKAWLKSYICSML
jgi:hypothetical protein